MPFICHGSTPYYPFNIIDVVREANKMPLNFTCRFAYLFSRGDKLRDIFRHHLSQIHTEQKMNNEWQETRTLEDIMSAYCQSKSNITNSDFDKFIATLTLDDHEFRLHNGHIKGLKWYPVYKKLKSLPQIIYTSNNNALVQNFDERKRLMLSPDDLPNIVKILTENTGVHFIYLLITKPRTLGQSTMLDELQQASSSMCCINTGAAITFFDPYNGALQFNNPVNFKEDFSSWFNEETNTGSLKYFRMRNTPPLADFVNYIEIGTCADLLTIPAEKSSIGFREKFCSWCEKKEKPTEKQFICCRACKKVFYCNFECLTAHWKNKLTLYGKLIGGHKDECRPLAPDSAASPASAATG